MEKQSNQQHEDFNLLMEDGSCKHFEFQSTNGGIEDLKRFRIYEAIYSAQNRIPVTTYVLYSGQIKNPVTQFTEGLNTYRVQPIIMRSKSAEKYIASLKQKVESGEKLTKQDLVPLTLFPLMGGTISMKERIKTAFAITRRAILEPEITDVGSKDIDRIEVVIYTMADKFLESMDMEEIKESVSMTRLGQMLVNDGIQRGRTEGEAIGEARGEARGEANGTARTKQIFKLYLAGKSVEEIAKACDVPAEKVEEILA